MLKLKAIVKELDLIDEKLASTSEDDKEVFQAGGQVFIS
jgi:hypothetical protein